MARKPKTETPEIAEKVEPSRKDALRALLNKYARAGASHSQWAEAWSEYEAL